MSTAAVQTTTENPRRRAEPKSAMPGVRAVFAVLTSVYAAMMALAAGHAAFWLIGRSDTSAARFNIFCVRGTAVAEPGAEPVPFERAAWLLSYEGWAGVALAVAQVAACVGGVLLTFTGKRALRTTGLALLLGMAGIWAYNGFVFRTLLSDGNLMLLYALAFLAVAVHAALLLNALRSPRRLASRALRS
ncbi:MAG: hypothetical protein AAFR38_05895 [Planctomycetota bacterium]